MAAFKEKICVSLAHMKEAMAGTAKKVNDIASEAVLGVERALVKTTQKAAEEVSPVTQQAPPDAAGAPAQVAVAAGATTKP